MPCAYACVIINGASVSQTATQQADHQLAQRMSCDQSADWSSSLFTETPMHDVRETFSETFLFVACVQQPLY